MPIVSPDDTDAVETRERLVDSNLSSDERFIMANRGAETYLLFSSLICPPGWPNGGESRDERAL
jgi:hypothetical protein